MKEYIIDLELYYMKGLFFCLLTFDVSSIQKLGNYRDPIDICLSVGSGERRGEGGREGGSGWQSPGHDWP